MYMSEYWQKVNIFVKTKNASWDLKCKINHNFFLTRGSQKGGVGSAIWEKFPNNPVFFFWGLPLSGLAAKKKDTKQPFSLSSGNWPICMWYMWYILPKYIFTFIKYSKLQAGRRSYEKIKEVKLLVYFTGCQSKSYLEWVQLESIVGVGVQVIPVDSDGDKVSLSLNLDVFKAGCLALLRPARLRVETLKERSFFPATH